VLLGQQEIRVVDTGTGAITTAGWLEEDARARVLARDGCSVFYASGINDHDIWMLDYPEPSQGRTSPPSMH
jgi:hypothetical protein